MNLLQAFLCINMKTYHSGVALFLVRLIIYLDKPTIGARWIGQTVPRSVLLEVTVTVEVTVKKFSYWGRKGSISLVPKSSPPELNVKKKFFSVMQIAPKMENRKKGKWYSN